MRTSREEWRRRIERWKDSGLTAEQYAAELGINPRTLQFWGYKLRREAGARVPRAGRKHPAPEGALQLVEVHSTVSHESGFELELGGAKRLRIPSGFDATALERLLVVLGRVQ